MSKLELLLEKFRSFSRLKQIAWIVSLTHLLAVFGLIGHHLITYKQAPRRPMLVRTIPSPKLIALPTQSSSEPISSLPAKPLKSAPKTEKKSTIPKKKQVPPKTAPAKETPSPSRWENSEEKKLIQEIATSLELLTKEPVILPHRSKLTLPSDVVLTAQIGDMPPSGATYSEILIAYLQNVLDLPEYGEVRARIEIDRAGAILDCAILESKNVRNSEFLKKRLPELAFPCFNDFGISDATLTFTITFRNSET
ncbi:MAG: hypothetical protein V4487_04245 [Chlamydiota bacterium]